MQEEETGAKKTFRIYRQSKYHLVTKSTNVERHRSSTDGSTVVTEHDGIGKRKGVKKFREILLGIRANGVCRAVYRVEIATAVFLVASRARVCVRA